MLSVNVDNFFHKSPEFQERKILRVTRCSIMVTEQSKFRSIALENPSITLTLNLDQVNAILNALGEGAYRVVQPIITDIQAQATSQLQPADAPATPVEPAAPAADTTTPVAE